MTYPTISHFIESITGLFIPLPIQTFGFFIVLAFFVAQYFIKKEFLRLENNRILNKIEMVIYLRKTLFKTSRHSL